MKNIFTKLNRTNSKPLYSIIPIILYTSLGLHKITQTVIAGGSYNMLKLKPVTRM